MVKSIVMESHSFERFPDGSVQDEGKAKTYFYANKFRSNWHIRSQSGSMIFDEESVFMITDGEVKAVENAESYDGYLSQYFYSWRRSDIPCSCVLPHRRHPVA